VPRTSSSSSFWRRSARHVEWSWAVRPLSS